MGQYFKPWRRKAGALILVVACLATVGWVRGYFFCDRVDLGGQGGYQRLELSRYGVMWFWNEGDANITWGDRFQYNRHAAGTANGGQPAEFHLGTDADRELLWYRNWIGFHFAKFVWKSDGMVITMWVVPYWAVVVFPSLSAAYLLLSKPRSLVSRPVANATGELSP